MGTRLLCSGALTMQQGMAWAALLATCKAPVRSCIKRLQGSLSYIECRHRFGLCHPKCIQADVVDVAERLLEALAPKASNRKSRMSGKCSHSL